MKAKRPASAIGSEWPSLEDVLPAKEAQRIRSSARFFNFFKEADTAKGRARAFHRPLSHSYEDSKSQVLDWCRFDESRSLADPYAKDVLASAAERGDFEFFVELGDVLRKKPTPLYSKVGNLEWFLVEHWAEVRDGLPQLCRLSSATIARVWEKRNGVPLSPEHIEKTRQRLGLVTARGRKLTISSQRESTIRFL